MQPLFGALAGGGVMLMVAVLGGALFRKDVMGFGDVKLFACLGLCLGIRGTVAVLIGASLLRRHSSSSRDFAEEVFQG